LDKDQDGVTFQPCRGSLLRDCNDAPAAHGAEERPGDFTPAECPDPVDSSAPLTEKNCPNFWYDGLDNDCSFFAETGGGLERDVLDYDGDGFPGIRFDDWTPLGVGAEWPTSLPKGAEDFDCDDRDPNAHPRAVDVPYDGLDANCDGLDDFDADGDLYIDAKHEADYAQHSAQPWYQGLPGGDCDDNAASSYPGAPNDLPYDYVDTNCDGANEFDLDGDGYIPETYLALCNQYNVRYGYTVSCATNDCDDGNAFKHEGARDDPYDGVDANCDLADDFDNDGDGFVSPDVYSSYLTFSAADWYDSLPSGDCEGDADPTVHPGVLEVIGDAHDQDCDGNIDTTSFAFGPMHTSPSAPVVASLTDEYVLGVFAQYSQAVGTDPKVYFGTGVTLPKLADFEESPLHYLQWRPPSSAQPFGAAMDLWAENNVYVVGYTYDVASSTFLELRERWLDTSTGTTGTFRNGPRVNIKAAKTTPQLDLDMRRDTNGDFWLGACGNGWVWFAQALKNTSTVPDTYGRLPILAEGAISGQSYATTGGQTCWLEQDSAGGMHLHSFDVTGGTNSSFAISGGGGAATVQDEPAKYSFANLLSVNDHHGLVTFALGQAGLEISDGTTKVAALTAGTTKSGTAWDVLDADAIDVGNQRYIAAIVADPTTGDPKVLLAFGRKTDAKLDDNVFTYAVPASNPMSQPQAPHGVSLMADLDRVIIAVSSNSTGLVSDATNTYDAMGWAVLAVH